MIHTGSSLNILSKIWLFNFAILDLFWNKNLIFAQKFKYFTTEVRKASFLARIFNFFFIQVHLFRTKIRMLTQCVEIRCHEGVSSKRKLLESHSYVTFWFPFSLEFQKQARFDFTLIEGGTRPWLYTLAPSMLQLSKYVYEKSFLK